MIEVWSEAGRCWLQARLDFTRRLVVWHNGSVSFNVEVRLSGEHAAKRWLLQQWGYRRILGPGEEKKPFPSDGDTA